MNRVKENDKMKEGYLQNKIRELDYKLKQQLELAEHLERQLQMIIDSKKEYKAFFNKLKNLDKFKDSILKEIAKENKIKIQSIIDQSNEIINKHIHDAVENSFKKVKKYVDRAIEQFQDTSFDKELVLKNSKNILFNEQLCILLMEELVRERILSNEKVDILTKRASIRAKKLEE
ncbi:hypothetical protein MBGDF03_00169 [Thermoplasmatales archaeon SCGC AB-540-F20]|nr:hypothetical protein MBGDF03_00169 [Thermoplasmatales archaeon SCGC AB-540-F20]